MLSIFATINRTPTPTMEIESRRHQQQQAKSEEIVGKGANKKKAKSKSRNNFDDVQGLTNGGCHNTNPTTTMDIIKSCTNMDDLSKKLEERLKVTTKLHNHDEEEEAHVTAVLHLANGEPTALVECTDAIEPNNNDPKPQVANQPTNDSNIIFCEPQNLVVHVEETTDIGTSSDSASSLSVVSEPSTCSSKEVVVVKTELTEPEVKIDYMEYESELQMPDIIRLIQKDLSEPYSIYTYRYFIHNWPKLCFLAMHETKCVGAIVCKLGMHRQIMKRGYIAMLAVDKDYRKLKIGTNLVQKAIEVRIL